MYGVMEATRLTATWANSDADSKLKMQGPCGPGYHVPTLLEWRAAIYAVTGTATGSNVTDATQMNAFMNTLKIPLAGKRDYAAGFWQYPGEYGLYWSSSPSSGYGGLVWMDGG